MLADKTKTVLLQEMAHRTKNNPSFARQAFVQRVMRESIAKSSRGQPAQGADQKGT